MTKARKFFDDLADSWDDLYYKDRQTRSKLDRLTPGFQISKGSKILDLGCGTGIISARLSQSAGAKGTVIGCDYSFSMLKAAEKKGKGIDFICADAHKLPFKTEYFDGVICFSCFPHFEDKPAVLREINRIIKPGGCLVISHLLSRRQINQVHRKVKAAVSGHMMLPKKQMVRALSKSGFRMLRFLDQEGLYLLRAEKITRGGLKPLAIAAR
jgi:ubiquinone/menaquinone biosynthesis C-methylase UbiE